MLYSLTLSVKLKPTCCVLCSVVSYLTNLGHPSDLINCGDTIYNIRCCYYIMLACHLRTLVVLVTAVLSSNLMTVAR